MHPVLDEIFDTLQTVCLRCDYYVTIECAQTICAPLLQKAQYATEVRRFSAHTRNRCVMKITKYPDVLGSTILTAILHVFCHWLFWAGNTSKYWPVNIADGQMGRYGVKVALLRCLIRLIIRYSNNCLIIFFIISSAIIIANISKWQNWSASAVGITDKEMQTGKHGSCVELINDCLTYHFDGNPETTAGRKSGRLANTVRL